MVLWYGLRHRIKLPTEDALRFEGSLISNIHLHECTTHDESKWNQSIEYNIKSILE